MLNGARTWGRPIAQFTLLIALGSVAMVLLGTTAPAHAAYQGTDLLDSSLPTSGQPDFNWTAYGIDGWFDKAVFGIPKSLFDTIIYGVASLIWEASRTLILLAVTIFNFAFDLDFINDSKSGLLNPLGQGANALYSNPIVQSLLTAAFAGLGLYVVWQAIGRRRYTYTLGQVVKTILLFVIALWIIQRPADNIGFVTEQVNDASKSLLAAGAQINKFDDVGGADVQNLNKEDGTDLFSAALFKIGVRDPWTQVQFGGRSRCAVVTPKTSAKSEDNNKPTGKPAPCNAKGGMYQPPGWKEKFKVQKISPLDKATGQDGVSMQTLYLNADDATRHHYFDAYNCGGDEGENECEDDWDKNVNAKPVLMPLVDPQQAGGQGERTLVTALVFGGNLGILLLVGGLSLAVVIVQLTLLVLLVLAPFALIAGIIPGRGHAIFMRWLTELGKAAFAKLFLTLPLVAILVVSAGLNRAIDVGALGWLVTYGIQVVFFWSIYLRRKQLIGLVSGSAAPDADDRSAFQRTARLGLGLATGTAAKALLASGRGGKDDDARRESAGDSSAATPVPHAQDGRADPDDTTPGSDGSIPPDREASEYDDRDNANGVPVAVNGSAADGAGPDQRPDDEPDETSNAEAEGATAPAAYQRDGAGNGDEDEESPDGVVPVPDSAPNANGNGNGSGVTPAGAGAGEHDRDRDRIDVGDVQVGEVSMPGVGVGAPDPEWGRAMRAAEHVTAAGGQVSTQSLMRDMNLSPEQAIGTAERLQSAGVLSGPDRAGNRDVKTTPETLDGAMTRMRSLSQAPPGAGPELEGREAPGAGLPAAGLAGAAAGAAAGGVARPDGGGDVGGGEPPKPKRRPPRLSPEARHATEQLKKAVEKSARDATKDAARDTARATRREVQRGAKQGSESVRKDAVKGAKDGAKQAIDNRASDAAKRSSDAAGRSAKDSVRDEFRHQRVDRPDDDKKPPRRA